MNNKEILRLEIGNRVTDIRENKMHMSKYQFAKLIGMHAQYLGLVENGQKGLTIEKVIDICNKTNVSADYLLFGTTSSIEQTSKKILSNYSNEEIYNAFEIMRNFAILLK